MANNLSKRIITGSLFVAVLITCIWASPISFIILFALITAVMLGEFYQLVNAYQLTSIKFPIHAVGGSLLFVCSAMYGLLFSSPKIFALYLIYLIYLFTAELYHKAENPIKNWAYIILGQVYIALPLSLLCYLGFQSGSYSPNLILSLFILIWLNDSGAFVVGCNIGKRRLFERISPKKSWEGFFGGFASSILGGVALSFVFTELSMVQWIIFGALTSAFATWGDLNESLFKRTLGVKDSGNILPGHGGMLDRFDSVLLAGPAVVIYLMLILA